MTPDDRRSQMALANFWKARAVVLEKAIKERDAEVERLTREHEDAIKERDAAVDVEVEK